MPTFSEIKALLSRRLTPSQFVKLRTKTESNLKLREADWDHAGSQAYRAATTDVCNAMREAVLRIKRAVF